MECKCAQRCVKGAQCTVSIVCSVGCAFLWPTRHTLCTCDPSPGWSWVELLQQHCPDSVPHSELPLSRFHAPRQNCPGSIVCSLICSIMHAESALQHCWLLVTDCIYTIQYACVCLCVYVCVCVCVWHVSMCVFVCTKGHSVLPCVYRVSCSIRGVRVTQELCPNLLKWTSRVRPSVLWGSGSPMPCLCCLISLEKDLS